MLNKKIKIFLYLLFPILFFTTCNKYEGFEKDMLASKGVMDLTNWDFDKNGSVSLNGEWEFYWNKLYDKSDFDLFKSPKKDGYIDVPKVWNKFEINNEKISGYGCATYRLRVKLNKYFESLALKVPHAATSIEIYVDDKLVSFSGIPGISKKTTQPGYYPHVIEFHPENSSFELILHVANFHNKDGGMWRGIILGTENQIRDIRENNLSLEFFLFGCILIMGLYHFGLYLIRKKEKSPLYFALFCIALTLRIGVTGEFFINKLIDFDWEMLNKLEYISLYFAMPLFVLHTRSLFPDRIPNLMAKVLLIVALGFSFFVIVFPVSIFSHTKFIYEIFILVVGLILTSIIIHAFLRQIDGATAFLIGWIVFFIAIINEYFYQNNILDTGHYFAIGLLFLIFSQAFIISSRFYKAFAMTDELTEQLDYINTNLEKIVKERTKEISQQKEEIEIKNTELETQRKLVDITNAKFRIIFEKSTEAQLLIADKIVDCNNATLLMLKINDKNELLRKHPIDFSPKYQPDGELSLKKILEQEKIAYKDGYRIFEWTFIKSDGVEFPVEVSLNPVIYQKRRILLAVWHDLTKRKKAENQLKAAHKEVMIANHEIIATNIQLEKQKEEIIIQKNEIEEKNINITSSINYAGKIQDAILTPKGFINQLFPENFVLYIPKDIISGDFYWFKQIGSKMYFAAADCTGHGVPGAFMSVLGISFLNEIVRRKEVASASIILDELREQIKTSLRQTGQIGENQDGMDIAFCIFDTESYILQYAGAHNPLFIFIKSENECNDTAKQEIEFRQIDADKMPVSIYVKEDKFENHKIQLKAGDTMYLFSDGYTDQFGGKNHGKFSKKRFRELLYKVQDLSMDEQLETLEKTFSDWKGENDQLDDVLVMGVKLSSKTKIDNDILNWSSKRVLIVEDNEDEYFLLELLLRLTNIEIIWRKNGEDAISLFKENSDIDIVLLDINIPGVDGYEVLRQIKEHNPTVPVIMQTSLNSPDDKEKGFKAGCNDYVSKPIQKHELITAISKFLSCP